MAILAVLAWAGLHLAHPFLAITAPVRGPLLVVDGWSPTYALPQVASEYGVGHYQQVLVVRGIYDSEDSYISGRYSGDHVGNLLVQHGVPREKLVSLFPSAVQRDRTFHSALAVKHWAATNLPAFEGLDIATLGPHARRSRLLYQKAFGGQIRVGCIALADRHYDPRRWWQSSEGVREVLGELIAYLYARFFFS